MTTNRKRIDKIQLSLSPKKVIMMLLENEMKFKSIDDSLLWYSQPQNVAQVKHRLAEVGHVIRREMKGQSKARIEQAVRQAMDDMSFLLTLHRAVNSDFVLEQREKMLMGVCLYYMFNVFIQEATDPESQEGFKIPWRAMVCAFLIERYTQREATRLIWNTYFEGRCFLFSDVATMAEQLIEQVEVLVDAYNICIPFLRRKAALGKLAEINLEELKAESQRKAPGVATHLLIQAKAEALIDMGRDREAKAIYTDMINSHIGGKSV